VNQSQTRYYYGNLVTVKMKCASITHIVHNVSFFLEATLLYIFNSVQLAVTVLWLRELTRWVDSSATKAVVIDRVKMCSCVACNVTT